MTSYFRIAAPNVRVSDKVAAAYHGKVTARYQAPSFRCACRKGAIVPVYPATSVHVEVPTALRDHWPALPGFERFDPTNTLLGTEDWLRWRSTLVGELEREGIVLEPESIQPMMPFAPIEFRRSSREPFSFAFPFEGVLRGTVVSGDVRRALEDRNEIGCTFTSLDDAEGSSILHLRYATVPVSGGAVVGTCPQCRAWLVDTKRRRANEIESTMPSGVPIAVLFGTRHIVIAEEVREALSAFIDASRYPPSVQPFVPKTQ